MKIEHHAKSHTNSNKANFISKVKIIKESKKSDFSRKKIYEEFGISKATISQILENQKTHLEAYDSENIRP